MIADEARQPMQPSAQPNVNRIPQAPQLAPAQPTPVPYGGNTPALAPMTPPTQTSVTAAPAQPAAPAAASAPGTPSVMPATQSFGPGNDLRSTQINPTATPRLTGTQGLVDQTANKLATGPDRFNLAQDRFKTFSEQTDPAFQASLRSATQKAAANGGIGSGMLSTDYGNLELARERELRGERDTLFNTALEGTIGDTRANLGLLSGLEGQEYGEGAQDRNELRGERGYQTGLEDQAYQRGVQGLTLEDALTNSAFGRGERQYQTGMGGNPAQMQMLLSQLYGQQGEQAGTALSNLIGSTTENNILKTIYGQGQPAPAGGAPSSPVPLPGDVNARIHDQIGPLWRATQGG